MFPLSLLMQASRSIASFHPRFTVVVDLFLNARARRMSTQAKRQWRWTEPITQVGITTWKICSSPAHFPRCDAYLRIRFSSPSLPLLAFPFARFIWLYQQYLHKRSTFSFEFELLWAQSCRLTVYQKRAEGKKSCFWRFDILFGTCRPRSHWYRLLGMKWQHSWSCFRDFQKSILNKQERNWVMFSRTHWTG